MGIDYGMGQTNVDTETGIRFGVLPVNDLGSWVWEDLMSNGEDMDFEAHKQQVKDELKWAIEKALTEYGYEHQNDSEELAEGIMDGLEMDGYEGSGDCVRYHYEKDGYDLFTASDGDMFVQKSEFYTMAPFCSPCAPGAGYLRDGAKDGDCKAYCLNHDWFEDGTAPYPVFRVSDNSEVLAEPVHNDDAREVYYE